MFYLGRLSQSILEYRRGITPQPNCRQNPDQLGVLTHKTASRLQIVGSEKT